jgi:phage tail-like protein
MRERVRKKLIMPDLLGLNQRDAQVTLRNAGFSPSRVRYIQSYEALDTVVEQVPLKGQLLGSNDDIEIKVAKKSYLQYLPQIFQVDSAMGNTFLREYLWIFQHIFDSINELIDNGDKYYDPRETPSEMLSWLASWVALSLDVDWPDLNKRKLIQNAAAKYRNRGTRRALEEMLGIFVGAEPKIEENTWPYPGFRIGVTSTMGEDSMILPPLNLDHCFVVHVQQTVNEISEEMVVKVHNIINMEKPAHTAYCLQFSSDAERPTPQTFMQIGVASVVGTAAADYEEAEDEALVPPKAKSQGKKKSKRSKKGKE